MVGIDAPGIAATTIEEFLQPFVPDAFDQFPVFPLSARVVYRNIAYCARCKKMTIPDDRNFLMLSDSELFAAIDKKILTSVL